MLCWACQACPARPIVWRCIENRSTWLGGFMLGLPCMARILPGTSFGDVSKTDRYGWAFFLHVTCDSVASTSPERLAHTSLQSFHFQVFSTDSRARTSALSMRLPLVCLLSPVLVAVGGSCAEHWPAAAAVCDCICFCFARWQRCPSVMSRRHSGGLLHLDEGRQTGRERSGQTRTGKRNLFSRDL